MTQNSKSSCYHSHRVYRVKFRLAKIKRFLACFGSTLLFGLCL